MTFTIEQIRNYLQSQDSFGDALYFLSEENIIKAQPIIEDNNEEDFLEVSDEEDDMYMISDLR